jgi:predicted RNase H-like HicB family nuclease
LLPFSSFRREFVITTFHIRIEEGTVTVEAILEEENKLRAEPIKISSVTRAINAMGCPITGLRREKQVDVDRAEAGGEAGQSIEKGFDRIVGGPDWLQKYRERIEKKAITVEDILEEENKLREQQIKLSTVTRAVNTMGYPITDLRRGKKSEQGAAVGGREKSEGEAIKTRSERTGSGPGWLQKYRERIEAGRITVEGILEEENKIRSEPIKISSVTRAVNAMGYPIVGLRRGVKAEAEAEAKAKKSFKHGEEPGKMEKGPGWLQKYRERIEAGMITVEGILEEENKIRSEPIKISSVTRAVNAMGYPIVGLRRERKGEVKKSEKPKKLAGTIEPQYFGIDKISEETEKRFISIKKSWEKELGKSLNNDYFVNVLIALAKLVEYGKTLTPVVS